MKYPRTIDYNLVSSQRARRVMDRIIGYKISPFLWKAIIELSGSSSLSAGRVQSVALKLICDREAEIDKFIPIEYWSIWAIFKTTKNEIFKAKLFSIGGKDIRILPKPNMNEKELKEFLNDYIAISDEKTAEKFFNGINDKNDFKITNITKRNTKRSAPAPFITSTLQQETSRRLRMRPKQTMAIAQKLYEGIDLGKAGTQGLITYMRTDSTRISEEVIPVVRDFIKNNFGNEYLPETSNIFGNKKENVQDAHEAIRPTLFEFPPERVKEFLDRKSYQVYELIWKRFVASQMNPAIFETTVIEITADEFIFKAFGNAVKFSGYQKVYEEASEKRDGSEEKEEYRNEKFHLV